jgi:DNA-binding CsgD family transcriptional regulator
MESLTTREQEVLQLIITGRSTKQIAADLGMSFKTAACHRYRIMSRSGASNAADLVRLALTASGNPPVGGLGSAITKMCEESRQRRLLLSLESARSQELRSQCHETIEEMQHLLESILQQCKELRRAVAYVPVDSDSTSAPNRDARPTPAKASAAA